MVVRGKKFKVILLTFIKTINVHEEGSTYFTNFPPLMGHWTGRGSVPNFSKRILLKSLFVMVDKSLNFIWDAFQLYIMYIIIIYKIRRL